AETFGRLQTAVPSNHGQSFIHHDRGNEPKCLYAVSNLVDLPIRVDTRVVWVRLDVLNGKDSLYAAYCNHRVLQKRGRRDGYRSFAVWQKLQQISRRKISLDFFVGLSRPSLPNWNCLKYLV